MLKTVNGLYKDRINKEWSDAARDASAEARRAMARGGTLISAADAMKHFGIGRFNLIPRDKPMRVTSKIDRRDYLIHSQGLGAFKAYPVERANRDEAKPYDPDNPDHERA